LKVRLWPHFKKLLILIVCLVALVLAGPAVAHGQSQVTHPFTNTSGVPANDLHIIYAQPIDDSGRFPEFGTENGASVRSWEALGNELYVEGDFPNGSTVNVTAFSAGPLVQVQEYWFTWNGEPVSNRVPVAYGRGQAIDASGFFQGLVTVNKSPVTSSAVASSTNVDPGTVIFATRDNGDGTTTIFVVGKLLNPRQGGKVIIRYDPPGFYGDWVFEITPLPVTPTPAASPWSLVAMGLVGLAILWVQRFRRLVRSP
jgi:hypothetical protein